MTSSTELLRCSLLSSQKRKAIPILALGSLPVLLTASGKGAYTIALYLVEAMVILVFLPSRFLPWLMICRPFSSYSV